MESPSPSSQQKNPPDPRLFSLPPRRPLDIRVHTKSMSLPSTAGGGGGRTRPESRGWRRRGCIVAGVAFSGLEFCVSEAGFSTSFFEGWAFGGAFVRGGGGVGGARRKGEL